MKIAIEALGIHMFGGGRSATINLLKTLFALDRDNDYILVLNQPEPELEADNVRQAIIPARNRFSARIGAQLMLLSCGRHIKPASEYHIAQIRKLYDLPETYILHVGRIDPKKNISVLIEAFARFRRQSDFQGKLVVLGEPYKKRPDHSVYERIEQLGLRNSICLAGAVPDEHLAAFYTGSSMVVLPSIYEGFGITALEAMTAGAPLIVNKVGAVTEVVGEAALIMPKNTSDALAELMANLWADDERRQALRMNGLQKASLFDINNSAR